LKALYLPPYDPETTTCERCSGRTNEQLATVMIFVPSFAVISRFSPCRTGRSQLEPALRNAQCQSTKAIAATDVRQFRGVRSTLRYRRSASPMPPLPKSMQAGTRRQTGFRSRSLKKPAPTPCLIAYSPLRRSRLVRITPTSAPTTACCHPVGLTREFQACSALISAWRRTRFSAGGLRASGVSYETI
jgi:hypothetical protein